MKKSKVFLLCSILCILLTASAVILSGCGNEVTLDNLSVKNNSMKSAYTVGETLDIAGGKLITVYSDDTEKEVDITADMVGGFDTSSVGEKSIIVTYQTKSVRFHYTVTAKPTPEEPEPEPDYSYFTTSEDENGNLTITGLTGEYPRELFFPASIGGKKVVAVDGKTADNKNAFAGAAIDKLEVGNGIERIGDNCFYNCTDLDEVILPDSLTELGDYVFESNTSLERVVLGDGLTALPAGTFCRCTTLTRVELPSHVETIGESAFYRCYALDEINLPDTVTAVDNYAFMYCNVLRSISLPNVETVPGYAFDSCPVLSSVEIPRAKTIKNNAFSNCTSLKSVDLSSAVTIGNSVFEESSVTSVQLSSALTTLGEGVFFNSKLESIILPSTLASMGKHCFARCENLTDATFAAPAENFTKIPLGAFDDCPKLSGFVIGEYITEIGEGAFSSVGTGLLDVSFNLDWTNATRLTVIAGTAFMDANLTGTILVPDTVEAIGYSAFQATKIEKLIFGADSALTTLGDGVARWANALTTVVLPKGITEFSSGWFDYGALENLDLSATKITAIPDNSFSTFDAYNSLKKVLLPDVCTAIGNQAFNNKTMLEEIKASGITSVGTDAFYNCNALASVDFFDTLETIGNNAFNGCKAVVGLTLGGNLSSLGNNAFQNCTELETVSVDISALTKIGDYCFSGDGKLAAVSFTGTANGSIEIGQQVFKNCAQLSSITIPEGMTKLGTQMFSGCTSLTNILIPSTVTSVTSGLFTGCTNLETVTLNITDISVFGSLTNLGWNSLAKMTAIYVPSEQVDNYKAKFKSKVEIIQAITQP